MKPVELSPEADEEVADAALYYERARSGFGVRFRDAIAATGNLIGANPAIGAKVDRTKCRLFPMTGFQHSIVYVDYPDRIYVVAVAHNKRRPGYWKSRLRRT
jgi:plasmid stabilization system protein ParE